MQPDSVEVEQKQPEQPDIWEMLPALRKKIAREAGRQRCEGVREGSETKLTMPVGVCVTCPQAHWRVEYSGHADYVINDRKKEIMGGFFMICFCSVRHMDIPPETPQMCSGNPTFVPDL